MYIHTAEQLVDEFIKICDQVSDGIEQVEHWDLSGQRPGQYNIDITADHIAQNALLDLGLGVLSEESGLVEPERSVLAVLDPIDGSTNASLGLDWFATSICAVDNEGMLAAVVKNQATGDIYTAIRGGGAKLNSLPIQPTATTTLAESIIAISGLPERHLGWQQFRAYGACALDMCAVAAGIFDGFADMSQDAHGVWDYLGAALICKEAGVSVTDRYQRELVIRDPEIYRTPVAAATPELHKALITAMNETGQ